mmetsp:Transcript_13733/g.20703  ORF Transcript_13733/g.20703 Transcript_13733/m.20703 type:complete len:477 (+) Transcript_13733:131-1561(+)
MRRANNRLLVFCVVIIHFLWGTSFWKGIQPNSNRIRLDFAADTVVVPLSKSCSISRDSLSTKNITSLPFPIGSRYKDMSLLASEIKTISHIPRKRQIVITHRSRLCANPYVIGRLSGEYVSIVQNWTRLPINDTAEALSQLVGHYNVPSKGKYYLEIIGLLCNDLSWDGEYKHVCLEDPSYMKLTDDWAHIYVDSLGANENTLDRDVVIGHWKMSNKVVSMPLQTRYQPEGCRGNKDERCFLPMSKDRFDPYQFEFQNQNTTFLIQDRVMAANEANHNILLCFVGLSHAREMAAAVNLWLQKWNTSNINAVSVDAQFPRLVNRQFIQSKIIGRKCTRTVIAAGQWSVGRTPPGSKYAGLPPTQFPQYRDEIHNMIVDLQASDANGIFLRSIHYNSLGDVKLTCPPQDWRHPAVIDQLNMIIKNLTQSMGVQFIDTSQIIGPMWDTAGDFCHYRNDDVSSSEALYMLGRLIQKESVL